jgi:hypothetical protein
MTRHVNELRVYETIHKPYHTAKMVIIDNNNIMDNIGLHGGESCSFVFDGGNDEVYENELHVFSVHGERSNQSLRAQIYDVHLIGAEYFNDKKSLVQQSFKNIPCTAAISQIHNKFIGSGLRVLTSSNGPIAKESYIVSAVKPFKAISDLRRRCVYGGGGNTLYYKDNQSCVLTPLKTLQSQLSAMETFYQKNTWGKNYFDIQIVQAIIAISAQVDESKGGRGSVDGVAETQNQGKSVFDLQTKKEVTGKRGGGLPNNQTMDGNDQPKSTDQSSKTESERSESAEFRNGPMVTVKVPIQTGIHCTVGKGIYLNILPPIGDMDDIDANGNPSMSGLYMVVELCHELKLDDRQMNGTTVMQAALGGQIAPDI